MREPTGGLLYTSPFSPNVLTHACVKLLGRAAPGVRPRELDFLASSPKGRQASALKTTFLDFEQPIADLEAKIEELRFVQDDSAVDISEEIGRLQKKSDALTKSIYNKLSAWQIALVARHPQRPYALDYIRGLFTDFEELHGDRAYGDDNAIVGGLARFGGESCVVLGHQKGRDTKEKLLRNFGMPKPEGYRKALRLMKLAEKFRMPIYTFVDTPGAYPGIGAEERGQSEAIGRNLYEMARLRVPILCTVIGEGGSGGALAIAVGDVLLMLQYATYSVISPEGCASILWKSAERAPEAAERLAITAARLKAMSMIDKVVAEPLGGAHRDPEAQMQSLRRALDEARREIAKLSDEERLHVRYQRLMGYGKFAEAPKR
jgi:acetyl-CoA carboxylase carboxyl transferase subunit alpha